MEIFPILVANGIFIQALERELNSLLYPDDVLFHHESELPFSQFAMAPIQKNSKKGDGFNLAYFFIYNYGNSLKFIIIASLLLQGGELDAGPTSGSGGRLTPNASHEGVKLIQAP